MNGLRVPAATPCSCQAPLTSALSASVQKRDLVSRIDGPLNYHCTVNSSLTLMISSQVSHDLGGCLPAVGIKRDHFAPGVAIGHDDHRLGTDLQFLTYEFVLAKRAVGIELEVNIRAEAPLVDIVS